MCSKDNFYQEFIIEGEEFKKYQHKWLGRVSQYYEQRTKLERKNAELRSLTKAFNAAPNADMKSIWYEQWNKLIQQYALDIKVKDIFKKEEIEHEGKSKNK